MVVYYLVWVIWVIRNPTFSARETNVKTAIVNSLAGANRIQKTTVCVKTKTA